MFTGVKSIMLFHHPETWYNREYLKRVYEE